MKRESKFEAFEENSHRQKSRTLRIIDIEVEKPEGIREQDEVSEKKLTNDGELHLARGFRQSKNAPLRVTAERVSVECEAYSPLSLSPSFSLT